MDALVRIGLATVLGAVIGIEREVRGQAAGMRTHALVACGAGLFTLVGAYGFSDFPRGANVDPMRVAAQIVSGIGFIGAGVILREGGSVRGVTTAAGLWAAAALGMAAGAGLYVEAGLGLGAVMLALIGLRVLRERGLTPSAEPRQRVQVTYRRGHGTLAPIVRAVEDAGATLERILIDDEDAQRTVELTVRARDLTELRRRFEELMRRPEVAAVALDPQAKGPFV
jgi:putative Mg2+ transporter-C (MgtC) family protein